MSWGVLKSEDRANISQHFIGKSCFTKGYINSLSRGRYKKNQKLVLWFGLSVVDLQSVHMDLGPTKPSGFEAVLPGFCKISIPCFRRLLKAKKRVQLPPGPRSSSSLFHYSNTPEFENYLLNCKLQAHKIGQMNGKVQSVL